MTLSALLACLAHRQVGAGRGLLQVDSWRTRVAGCTQARQGPSRTCLAVCPLGTFLKLCFKICFLGTRDVAQWLSTHWALGSVPSATKNTPKNERAFWTITEWFALLGSLVWRW